MTITLEAIRAEHTKIGEMIAAFEKKAITEYRIAGATIPLAPGERFAGAVLNDDGALSHYLIKLPGEVDSIDWCGARRWAEERGASLPTKQEQALLYANLKSEFTSAWYWSGDEHESDDAYAWCTNFSNGFQYCNAKISKLRGVAVRRFIPSVI